VTLVDHRGMILPVGWDAGRRRAWGRREPLGVRTVREFTETLRARYAGVIDTAGADLQNRVSIMLAKDLRFPTECLQCGDTKGLPFRADQRAGHPCGGHLDSLPGPVSTSGAWTSRIPRCLSRSLIDAAVRSIGRDSRWATRSGLGLRRGCDPEALITGGDADRHS
jgi:hypothetical protein